MTDTTKGPRKIPESPADAAVRAVAGNHVDRIVAEKAEAEVETLRRERDEAREQFDRHVIWADEQLKAATEDGTSETNSDTDAFDDRPAVERKP